MKFVSPIFDLYSDYLLVYQSQPTATRLSALVEGKLSHDAITRRGLIGFASKRSMPVVGK